MAYWWASPYGNLSSGETKLVGSNGKEISVKALLNSTEVVLVLGNIDFQGDGRKTSIATVLKGNINYDASGQLLGGTAKDIAIYQGEYPSNLEGAQYWHYTDVGYTFTASNATASGVGIEKSGASLVGLYNSSDKGKTYSDLNPGDNSRFLSFPISHSRDSIASYPDSSLFPSGWWNNLSNISLTSSNSSSSSNSATNSNNLSLSKDYSVSNVISNLLGNSTTSSALSVDISDKTLTINASSWSGSIKINLAAKASDKGDTLTAKQIDFNSPDTFGSVIQGGSGNDVIMGKAGWDILDGGAGNDLIHGGNGRDIITGGVGSDELHGDFGWNTYKSEKDGSSDLIAIKSDQWLVNWMYGQAGNNPNGEKADIIEGLDSIDQIRIIGCDTKDLTFQANATAHGVSGIGIYAKGALEAVYTGGDLSLGQIQAMTSGDGSSMAMNNNINSYGWTQHPGTFVAS